jgi:formamidopyrimidine-DNA glycosylase
LVVIQVEDSNLVFSDGVNLRFHSQREPRPAKHQLLVEFADSTALSAVVQMYGGIVCFTGAEYDNPYYKAALDKPAVLSPAFDQDYFLRLITAPDVQKLSLKAFLATQQRIPGLGNGVLQDILFNANQHPKRKVNTLNDKDKEILYQSVVYTLTDMLKYGGRDTEKDLFGKSGGYLAKLSKNTAAKPCPVCGTKIIKEAYMGGSVYYCAGCQKI